MPTTPQCAKPLDCPRCKDARSVIVRRRVLTQEGQPGSVRRCKACGIEFVVLVESKAIT